MNARFKGQLNKRLKKQLSVSGCEEMRADKFCVDDDDADGKNWKFFGILFHKNEHISFRTKFHVRAKVLRTWKIIMKAKCIAVAGCMCK